MDSNRQHVDHKTRALIIAPMRNRRDTGEQSLNKSIKITVETTCYKRQLHRANDNNI